MLIKSLAGLVAAAGFGLLAGCAAPCGAPGRLCAPAGANTSAQAAIYPTAGSAAVPAQLPEPVREAPSPERLARAAPGATVRIGLLLPLQSDKLRVPAEAVRAGFMAAWQHERAGFEVDLVATGDSVPEVLDAYAQAAAQDDIIVGPLARPAVEALAASALVTRPTVALNHPEQPGPVPRTMLVLGLSIEDEARQAAQWASDEHPNARALVLGGAAAWQQRAAGAFEARWSELGHGSGRDELAGPDGLIHQDALDELKARIEIDPPDLLFAALDAGQLRLVRAALGGAIPCYGISPANPGGAAAPVAELNGVRLLDLPWEVLGDAPQAAPYPRWKERGHTLDMDRLYALGIDAFRVARQLALHPDAPFTLDGVTGKLAVDAGAVVRTEAAVVLEGGAFRPAR